MSRVRQAVARSAINALTRPHPHPFGPRLTDRARGRTVLVTGASSGIGRGLALRLAGAGATVLVTARRAAELEALCAEIKDAGGIAHALPADLAIDDGIDALADRVLAEHGAPDIVVLNAGRSMRRSIARSEHRLHDYERALRVNYLGSVGLILRLLPAMRERRSGQVVTSSSLGVQGDVPRFSAYVASKAALDAFTRIAAVECLADGITFTTVHLPLVDTEMIGPTGWDGFTPLTVDGAVDMLCDAIRRRPDHVGTLLGTAATIGSTVTPGLSRQLLHRFHRAIPDSKAARGGTTDD